MRAPLVYQRLLDAVSRSFALCIPQLDSPFRDRVALAYLLLRVLDTVEDAPFTDRHLQQRQFTRLRSFLSVMPSRAEIDAFVDAFPDGVADHDRMLLDHSYTLLADGHALPERVRSPIFRAIERMGRGMAAYTQRRVRLRLVDVEDVTRYCCFVAGLVGEMLTDLWSLSRPETPPPTKLAYRFGLFLQKVNILKDQREDEAEGRFLVPDRLELLASLRGDTAGALAYLQALPTDDRGYRTFCAWCLMMGAVTLAELDRPHVSRRAETAQLLARTAEIATDNAALERQLAELMPPLPVLTCRPPRCKPESAEWFREALAAPLTIDELRELGIADDRAVMQTNPFADVSVLDRP